MIIRLYLFDFAFIYYLLAFVEDLSFHLEDCRICVWNAGDGSLVHSLTGHTASVSPVLYLFPNPQSLFSVLFLCRAVQVCSISKHAQLCFWTNKVEMWSYFSNWIQF